MNVAPGVWLRDQLYFGGLRFEEIRYEAGLAFSLHSHGHAFFDLNLSGCVEERCHGERRLRTPSSLAYLPIGEPHATRQDDDGWTFQIVVPPDWLEAVREGSPFEEEVVLVERQWPTWAAYRLFAEFKRRDDLTPLVIEDLLQGLLLGTLRDSSGAGERPGWLGVAEAYLRDHFLDSITPEAVGRAAGVHPAYLMRTFRRHYRRTLGEFVRELRIAYACRLLAGPVSLAEVAVTVGFADQSHLHRTFRAYMGMTPREYRKVVPLP